MRFIVRDRSNPDRQIEIEVREPHDMPIVWRNNGFELLRVFVVHNFDSNEKGIVEK